MDQGNWPQEKKKEKDILELAKIFEKKSEVFDDCHNIVDLYESQQNNQLIKASKNLLNLSNNSGYKNDKMDNLSNIFPSYGNIPDKKNLIYDYNADLERDLHLYKIIDQSNQNDINYGESIPINNLTELSANYSNYYPSEILDQSFITSQIEPDLLITANKKDEESKKFFGHINQHQIFSNEEPIIEQQLGELTTSNPFHDRDQHLDSNMANFSKYMNSLYQERSLEGNPYLQKQEAEIICKNFKVSKNKIWKFFSNRRQRDKKR